MKNTIIQELKKIEIAENIRILYAVESGSRAWGFPSKDSDYDVRFIYTRPKNWYLQLQKTKDTLEYPISDQLDISGWDLDKTLLLLKKCNPSLLEWLHSPIVYLANPLFHQELLALSKQELNSKSLVYHYLHMAKGNYREYLQGDQVKIKKYFYVLRPLLACMWIDQFAQLPPVPFEELLKQPQLSKEFLLAVAELLKRKRAGEEMDLEEKIPVIDHFIVKQIDYHTEAVSSLHSFQSLSENNLNHFFLKWYRLND